MPTPLPDLHATQTHAKGDEVAWRITILDAAGVAYPLIGATIQSWKLEPGVFGATSGAVALDQDDAGVSVTIDDAQNAQVLVTFSTDALEPGIYYHQLNLRNINGVDRMSAHGHLDLREAL